MSNLDADANIKLREGSCPALLPRLGCGHRNYQSGSIIDFSRWSAPGAYLCLFVRGLFDSHNPSCPVLPGFAFDGGMTRCLTCLRGCCWLLLMLLPWHVRVHLSTAGGTNLAQYWLLARTSPHPALRDIPSTISSSAIWITISRIFLFCVFVLLTAE